MYTLSRTQILSHTYTHTCTCNTVSVTGSKASAADRDMFLGLLFPADEHRIYGYVTTTNIKLILVVSDPSAVDRDIKKLFRTIHDSYISLVANPFYSPDSVIESSKFDKAVEGLLAKPSKPVKSPTKLM
jgi:hypothetical protein